MDVREMIMNLNQIWVYMVFYMGMMAVNKAQNIFISDNCDLINCPLDCQLTFVNNVECPVCNCPLGQRCPQLNCPPEPTCLKVQRLDGCLNCACAGATYHSYDAHQNMATFVMNPQDRVQSKETCNLYDMQSVQRCTKDLLSYTKSIERTNPDVVAHPMISMFLYSGPQLLELCNIYSQSLRCVATDTMKRCSNQERHIHMMISMFEYTCSTVRHKSGDQLDKSLNEYECIHNILVAHVNADECSNKMITRFDRTSKDERIQSTVKRQLKCATLNEFLDCVEPTLDLFCGKSASVMFRSGLLNATNAIAPECVANGNKFVPVFVDERYDQNQRNNSINDRRLVIR